MWQKIVLFTAVFLFLIGITPPATNLADLTGEEEPLPQLRGAWQWLYSSVRPQPNLAPTAVTQQPISPYGVNSFLEQEALPSVREESLRHAHAAGFRFIRQQFVWEDIEIHGKGDFIDRRNDPNGVSAWDKYDNIVELAEAQGIEIIARLDKPPAWSRALPPEESGSYAPPDDFQDFADFATAVAERYQGRIHYYQIWNEPNGNNEWGYKNVDPEAFTRLLCLTHDSIKAVDPTAIILAGALTPTVALDGRNLNDLVFLQRMYQAGAGDCFDIMSAQGYGLWSGAMDRRLRPTVINYGHNLLIRDLMVANGDGHKPIWISEMAWNSVPENLPANFGRVSEAQQAQYTLQAYDRLQAEWPWVGVGNYWFLKRATDSEREQPFYYFRLLEPDFTPLPVYEALVARAEANQPPPAAQPLWWYVWQFLRPFFLLIGGGILLFFWLRALAPKTS
jgi:polysaccharide biosynthesis protein PslG